MNNQNNSPREYDAVLGNGTSSEKKKFMRLIKLAFTEADMTYEQYEINPTDNLYQNYVRKFYQAVGMNLAFVELYHESVIGQTIKPKLKTKLDSDTALAYMHDCLAIAQKHVGESYVLNPQQTFMNDCLAIAKKYNLL